MFVSDYLGTLKINISPKLPKLKKTTGSITLKDMEVPLIVNIAPDTFPCISSECNINLFQSMTIPPDLTKVSDINLQGDTLKVYNIIKEYKVGVTIEELMPFVYFFYRLS